MSTKNNSKWYEFDTIKNFQPMPKRFMVWGKKKREIVRSIGLFDLYFRACLRYDTTGQVYFADNADFIIFQSTNLFDKDGKEIFEGSIVENIFIYKFGLVYYDEDVAGWRILYQDGTWDDLYYVKADIVAAGHILSNPELLEGEK